MSLTQEKKTELIKKYGKSDKDTGSAAVQIAMLTQRINDLTEHMQKFPKDFAARYGLVKLVGQRRRFQDYLKRTSSQETYKDLLKKLKLRK